jgi:hypothetical protein
MEAELRKRFDGAMFDVYRRAKSEAKYNATAFLHMLNKDGGWLTAKALINAPRQSDGFTALHLAGRLDLTVEALVLEHAEWRSLFAPEELDKAAQRLVRSGYQPKMG